MVRYLILRFAYFLVTCLVVSFIGFAVSVSAPGDPVDRMTTFASGGPESYNPVRESEKNKLRHKLGMDLPLFYCSLHSAAEPDTLYKVFPVSDRKALEKLLRKHGSSQAVQRWYKSVQSFQDAATGLEGSQGRILLLEDAASLRTTGNVQKAGEFLTHIDSIISSDSSAFVLRSYSAGLHSAYDNVSKSDPTWRNYVPVLHFHRDNRYHRWLFGDANGGGILRGDFGKSYISGQPVSTYIKDRLPWTICLAFLSVIFAYAVSIPMALRMARRPGGKTDRILGSVLYLLYAMPVFWVGMILLMVFANPNVLSWFPASGVKPLEGYAAGANALDKVIKTLPYLVLPTVCYAYAFIAFLTRLLRTSLGEEEKRDYVKMARAKGLKGDAALNQHALRNALLPAVTVFAEVFPLAIGGSVLIESIFTIPGMGTGLFQAVQSEDFPVMVCIFLLTGLVTMAGYFITDIIYAFLDPRIRYA